MEREKPERVIESVGRRIAELRQERGWTQEQTAEKLGVSLRHMKRLEAGHNLTLHSLVRIAVKLGVPTAALLQSPKAWGVRARGRPTKKADP